MCRPAFKECRGFGEIGIPANDMDAPQLGWVIVGFIPGVDQWPVIQRVDTCDDFEEIGAL